MTIGRCFLLLVLVGLVQGHDRCPYGHEWREVKDICYRESHEEKTFQEAVRFCITRDIQDGPGGNILQVGKLRNLRNRYDHTSHHSLRVEIDPDHLYYVNGIKSPDGEWREYPSGRLVDFSHFPRFHANHGKVGDVLVWYPRENQLKISDNQDHHHVLCYRPTEMEDCERCPGFNQGRECSNAGDCVHGVCHCDHGFYGNRCEHHDRKDVDLIVIGRQANDAAANGTNVEIFNFESKTSCIATVKIPDNTTSGEALYFNHRARYCDTYTTHCYYYERENNNWLSMADFKTPHVNGAFNLVANPRSVPQQPTAPGLNYLWPDHYWWLVSGGIINPGSANQTRTSQTELFRHGRWEDPLLPPCNVKMVLPEPLSGQCAVQINNCETAVIGGINNNGTANNFVYVFNWRDEVWRIATVTLTVNVTNQVCSLIKDPLTGGQVVLVAGGKVVGGNLTRVAWTWDPVTGNKLITTPLPVAGANLQMIRYTDTKVLIVNTDTQNDVYTFSLTGGYQNVTHLLQKPIDPAAMLVPHGLIKCQSS